MREITLSILTLVISIFIFLAVIGGGVRLLGFLLGDFKTTPEERRQNLYERCVNVASSNTGFSIDECNKIKWP